MDVPFFKEFFGQEGTTITLAGKSLRIQYLHNALELKVYDDITPADLGNKVAGEILES